MSLAGLSIKRPTFILALVTAMMVVGLISLNRLGVDQFPDITFPVVSVFTSYRGAGPSEIETQVTKPLEEEISSISGIKHISSTSQDGLSIVTVEFSLGTDTKYAEQQVRDKALGARAKLPRDIDDPVLKRYDPADLPMMRLALTADLEAGQIYDLAKDSVKTKLEQLEDVAVIQILGGTQREVQVDIDRQQLYNAELSLTSVAQRMTANSQNVPVGKVSRGAREISFRTLGEFRSLDQIERTAVSFFGSDRAVSVGRLGTVKDSVEDTKSYAYFNQRPAVYIDVYRQSGTNTVKVADRVLKTMKNLDLAFNVLPGKPQLLIIQDLSRVIRWNVEDVRTAIFEGVLLTIIVVYFFLGSFRSTFITAIALPNSLLGGFILMYLLGFTINVITLLALSLAVGLLIDDAIVVRENIWRHIKLGQEPKRAAIEGTQEVMLAVVATTATIISVFAPVGFLGGTVGQFFRQLGWTVVFVMAVSLFDALTMAPLLSAYFAKKGGEEKVCGGFRGAFMVVCSPLHWLVAGFEDFQTWLTVQYERTIRFCLKHRGWIFGGAALIFILSLGIFPNLKKTFIPLQDVGYFRVSLEAPPGTSLENMRQIALDVQTVLLRHPELEKVGLLVGNEQGEANVAEFYLELVNYRKRKVTTSDLKQAVREELKPFSAVSPKVGDVGGFGNRAPFTMVLAGNDLDLLAQSADQVKTAFSNISGLADLDTNYRPGKPEFQVVMDPERMQNLGVSAVTAGAELRGMVDGIVPAKFRAGDKEYDIRVRLRPDQRDLREGLDQFYVPNMNNNLIKLSSVAKSLTTSGPLKINRRDRQRYIQISGELGPGGAIGNIQNDASKIMKKLKLPEGVTYQFIGQAEDLADLIMNMLIAMGLAILLIYLVLASLYESLVMPLLIMLALPMAVIGALGALLLFGQTLNMFSMIAMIMLLGLVVKNSILLVDYTIHLIRHGMSRQEAIIQAGKIRLRPILMTSVAIVAGTLPLALALSEVSRFRQSMGIAIIGGLISSTFLTLLVVPSGFEWADDFRLWTRKLLGRPPQREIDKAESKEEAFTTNAAYERAGRPKGKK